MSKIGIMGGTFNPIHNGHLQIAKEAYCQLALDEVWFMPAGQPPHKQVYGDVTKEDRRHMVELAIDTYSYFKLYAYELDNPNPSYSYRTLQHLKEERPEDLFYFIIGADSLYSFHKWVHPEMIVSCAQIVVANREDLQADQTLALTGCIATCQKQYGGTFHLLDMPCYFVSSSQIREAVQRGQTIASLVPHEVAAYITEHNLYQEKAMEEISIEELQKEIKDELKSQRYEHTMGVMYTAAALAMRYEYPMEDAMIAGLLHDCAKCLSDEKRISICEKQQIPIKPIERAYPHLLHAKTGAFLAREKYHVTDPDILHAIEVHTTGCPEMGILDMILYISDYIEPHRDKAPRLETVRHEAFTSLERTVLMILEDTVNYLDTDKDEMDDTTMEAYEYYKRRATEWKI